ncbi:PilN domain-containing protein [Alkalimonas delamerensis]|uniref:PilN domain-containing protein n=1 Tax=Alkalimonas delamerensis TaxID=265981 RepID=A0ABT9GM24_9GAMM|nr:PilN domain-containing protein [Alkalimonas delamerensis]MDP4527875.1 PilN domain-containing protein [Alkalimonas delamerensis]
MAHINLLPWRQEARKEQQKQYITILSAVALMSFMLVFVISSIYSARLEGQQKRNQYLQGEINKLNRQIAEIRDLNETKNSLQQRMSLIAQLQGGRNQGTQIMDEVVRVVPSGVYLTSLEKRDNAILIHGRSESNNRLANMIRLVEDSALLSDPLLEFIETGRSNQLLSDFKMHVRVQEFDAMQGEAP